MTFSGKAFPNAKIFVVDKMSERNVNFETMVDRDATADAEGTFQINFVGIAKASHSFGLIIKDKDNRSTQTKFFNIDTAANELTVKDILVPPTVGIPQRLISRGKPVVVTGNAFPGNRVILEVDGIIEQKVFAEGNGLYTATLDTGALEFGTHVIRAKQVDVVQKLESDYSMSNAFVVSRLTLPKVDLSGDGIVDIKDWSMFLSSWGSKDVMKRKMIDLNGDGRTDISDFSVFIRAVRK